MSALVAGLRFYTDHAPFHRGRGAFLRPIEFLKRRGWPPPQIAVAPGVTMELEPSLLGWTLFERGEWEPDQTARFLSLVQPGAVVLDVGANTGYYALLAAARGAKVHAFEIQPAIIRILRRNIERNRLDVTVVEAGAFSAPGEATIEDRGDPGSARVHLGGTGFRVPLVTLDAYAAGFERVDVILIDTEGADFEVLKGARALLAKHRPAVMTEVHHLGAFGGSEEELRAYMAQFDYRVETLHGEFSTDLLFLPTSPSRPEA